MAKLRPVWFGIILGLILGAIFTWFTPAPGADEVDWLTVLGISAVGGGALAFVLVEMVLPAIKTDLWVWILSIIFLVFGIYIVFIDADFLGGPNVSYWLGASTITGGVSMILYKLKILEV